MAPPRAGIEVDLDAPAACHDMLVRLAGRLPDELLWRLRDWLAGDARLALARTLPRALLRHRVGLTDGERQLMVAAVGQWGARPRLMDAVPTVAELEDPDVEFDLSLGTAGWDPVDLVLVAVVREAVGATELCRTWRLDARRTQRVVLVQATSGLPGLTGTLQRLLRANGDRTPCVEVLPPHLRLPPYHHRALLASAALWRAR